MAIGESGDVIGLLGEIGRAGGDLKATFFVDAGIRTRYQTCMSSSSHSWHQRLPSVSIDRAKPVLGEGLDSSREEPVLGLLRELRRKGFPDIRQV